MDFPSSAAPLAQAIFFLLVEVTPENMEQHEDSRFSSRRQVEGESVRLLIGILRVPSVLEQKLETRMQVRDGQDIILGSDADAAGWLEGHQGRL